MLMLISEQPLEAEEPEGILYRTPFELAHTDANTPLVVVLDLPSQSLALLEWVASRSRITIWLSPGFPTPDHQLRLQAPGVDGKTFINWLHGWMALDDCLQPDQCREVQALLQSHRYGWLLAQKDLPRHAVSLQGIDYSLKIASEEEFMGMTLEDFESQYQQLKALLAPKVLHNALFNYLPQESCLLLSGHPRHVLL
ncbi:hypothetical protein AOX56_21580 [Aeromonas sobria]|uniref:Uncharacterized protein n=1 Tax=Aeromonas sobria TaxID=646 RepID=A0A2N3IPP1_AERSO|nr:hypothetical protein [Aeromonas sobria]PKQ73262.1 hypothetical protein AOX56_21580 [Aeromonas sobria]